MVDIDWNTLIAALITIVSILIAWWQNRQKKEIVEFFTEPTAVSSVGTKVMIDKVPIRSWKMSPDTLKWILFGESEEDKRTIEGQILTAESDGLTSYSIRYSKGFYLIQYGLIKSSGREK